MAAGSAPVASRTRTSSPALPTSMRSRVSALRGHVTSMMKPCRSTSPGSHGPGSMPPFTVVSVMRTFASPTVTVTVLSAAASVAV